MKASPGSVLEQARLLLQQAEEEQHASATASQELFWRQMRSALAVNGHSIGLDILDAVALAVLDGDDTNAAFSGPVYLLPSPFRLVADGHPPAHPRFRSLEGVGPVLTAASAPPAVPSSDSSASSVDSAPLKSVAAAKKQSEGKRKRLSEAESISSAGSPARPADPAPPKSVAAVKKQSKGKRKRSSATKSATMKLSNKSQRLNSAAPTSTTEVGVAETFGFELAPGTPQQIREDLTSLFTNAQAREKMPYQVAYPWEGMRLWYDPIVYPELHTEHWRFWNEHRSTFWECALNAPMRDVPKEGGRRRKLKLQANQARLHFLSLCIEAWGYYAFLKAFEASKSGLFWLGGQPGKFVQGAKKFTGVLMEDLGR